MYTAKILHKKLHGLDTYFVTIYNANGSIAGHTQAFSREGARTQAAKIVKNLYNRK